MSNAIHVFIGTDPRQRKAERALENSIRLHTRADVSIHWMNHALGGIWSGWSIGRERGRIPLLGNRISWATEFTCFRFAIPEVAGFAGRAIYLDVDMIVIDDIVKLAELEMTRPWITNERCSATMLIDCAYFARKSWWPRVDEMKRSGWTLNDYMARLRMNDAIAFTIPDRWNCRDGKGLSLHDVSILHFTARMTQVWRPYPDRIRYMPHPRQDLEELWWRMYLGVNRESQTSALSDDRIRQESHPELEGSSRLK